MLLWFAPKVLVSEMYLMLVLKITAAKYFPITCSEVSLSVRTFFLD